MAKVAVASSSQLAADAAREVADAGGNAVDCALAASLVTMNTEPGVCALAGSAFVTVWPPDQPPVTIDGNVAIPGKGLRSADLGRGTERVAMEYGGGVETLVGVGSVGVPGSLAAIEKASQKYGVVDWATLFGPSVRATREGFPLSSACHYYLGYSADCVFGRSRDGHAALHDAAGNLHPVGRQIYVPGLSDTLAAIADEGAALFYRGELAASIAEHCHYGEGSLTREDLQDYEAIEREPLMTSLGPWQLACNPAPAIGGAVLGAMLLAEQHNADSNLPPLQRLIEIQRYCLEYRQQYLDLAEDVTAAIDRLLDNAKQQQLLMAATSASTVHTSAVDANGTACSVTASSGYGSGEIPGRTGLWLNNSLGELELNRRGLDAGPVGARLPSNMNPSIARNNADNRVLAVGSPGADRITTAMQQFLNNYLFLDLSLEESIARPRVHVDTSGPTTRLMAEPGLSLPSCEMPVRQFDTIGMYFGGVGVAEYSETDGLAAAADPRREGGVCIHTD